MKNIAQLLYLASATLTGVAFQSPAKATDCVVSAYAAFVQTKRTTPRHMECSQEFGQEQGQVSFLADPEKGLFCTGKTSEQGNHPSNFTARFFATPGSAISSAHNGWRVTDYHITGGPVAGQLRHDGTLLPSRHRDTLISFSFSIAQRDADFSRELRTITFSKPDGHCSRVLQEALDWSR